MLILNKVHNSQRYEAKLHFVHCERIPQQGRSLCSDKILTCLKTCLWNPGTQRHKIVRLSSAQFGLVMKTVLNTQNG